MSRRLPLLTLLGVLVACLTTSGSLHSEEPLLQVDTAYITQDGSGRGWVIGTDLVRYSVGTEAGAIVARGITDPVTNREWRQVAGPDSSVSVGGHHVEIGSADTTFARSEVTEWWGGVKLDLVYRVPTSSLEITRSYAAYPGSSVIETWTNFHNVGKAPVKLGDLTSFELSVKPGTLRWLRGLTATAEEGGPFTMQSRKLDAGEKFEIGSTTRSSERQLPWFSVRGDDPNPDDESDWAPEFFGSILWGGSWRLSTERLGGELSVRLGLPPFETRVDADGWLETPHAVFGVTNPVVPEVSQALRSFIDKGVRHGRPLRADVTYNTWFTYGTFINEASLRAEMAMAAEMGIEQFVVDAGWWAGIHPEDPSDFSRGLGSWEVDTDRFPNGLGALTDYAHELGMRFGVWIEPERVDLGVVFEKDGVDEKFLATTNGRYNGGGTNGEATYGQVCLADPAAREWVIAKIHAFVDAVRPDYIKWDNNFWINCTRASHGHGTEDGNFQHHAGLGTILSELRESYPSMDIENSASGGNRLSLGMLAYTDAGWMDDHSSPSTHVRHNLGGLSVLFPPAYMFSFAMGDVTEEFVDAPDADLPLLVRSRMSGMLGGTWSASTMGEGTRAVVAKQVALYKRIRPIIQQGAAFLLGPQVMSYPDAPWWGWDAIEHVQASTGDAVVFAFNTDDSETNTIVKPRSLRPDAIYEVESADYGVLGEVSGAELMARGIEISASGVSRSHVLIFHARVDPTIQRRRR